jgi:hypothetical protein
MFHDKLDGFVAGIASKRNSALIMSEAQGDPERERELREEDEDRITALPQQKYLQPHTFPPPPPGPPPNMRLTAPEDRKELPSMDKKEPLEGKKREFHFPPMQPKADNAPHFNYAPPTSPNKKRFSQNLSAADAEGRPSYVTDSIKSSEQHLTSIDAPIHPPELAHLRTDVGQVSRPRPTSTFGPPSGFEFGFPETPTDFQKSLMRFAFPVPHQIDGGWSVEYGRPDLGFMLKEWATGGADGRGILGRRTAVFVCGPPAMRVGVATTVARLQAEIWGDDELEEIFLHTENYAL